LKLIFENESLKSKWKISFINNNKQILFFSFNRKEQDFDSLDIYNDYLEMVETYSKIIINITNVWIFFFLLVFNLTNKVDVDETERKIAEYKELNKDLINKNRGKLVSEINFKKIFIYVL